MKSRIIVFLFILIGLPISTSVQAADTVSIFGDSIGDPVMLLAGPPADKGPHGKGHKDKGHHGGGPPPWAPAHGYRRAHSHYHEYGLSAPPLDIDTGHCNREVMGQILGGVAGAAVGSQIGDGTGRLIAVATGTVIGMIAGREIGRTMDRADALCVDQALEHAPNGETVRWQHDGHQYAVTPQETYQGRDGAYCREYVTESSMDGHRERVSGTACRQDDGSWRIVN